MLKYSLERKSVPVVLTLTDGNDESYALLELDGTARDRYLNDLNKQLGVSPRSSDAKVKDFTGLQALLVCRCLHRARHTASDDGPRVAEVYEAASREFVQQMPSSVLVGLFDACQQLCGFDTEDKEKGDKGE